MSPKLVTKLKEKFPKLMNPDPKTMFSMFGIECRDGWYNILCKLLSNISKQLKKTGNNHFEITQIKEKFGTLRFYCFGTDDKIRKYIRKAEDESAKTCEICGKPGKLYDDGWLVTRCKKCYTKRLEEIKHDKS